MLYAVITMLDMRDAPSFGPMLEDGSLNLDSFVENVRKRVRRISEGRLKVPSEVPYTEAHNTWAFNKPGVYYLDRPTLLLHGIALRITSYNVCYTQLLRCSDTES